MAAGRRRTSEAVTGAFQWMADTLQVRRPTDALVVSALIALALAFVWLLVYATNGTSNVFLHAMYIPIIVASLTLGLLGGVITAVAGGVLVGPLMPLNVELAIAQPLENTIYRTAYFLLIALTTGAFAASTRRRQALLLQAKGELAEMNSRNLRLFARLVSDRDEQTGGHCERVAQNTVMVARSLGVTGREIKQMYWGALLHDLGKLGVPESILRKSGRLTSEEFNEIKKHPAFGESILLDISEAFTAIGKGVRSHHERWDGSGYPDGLKGERIPLLGRIIAVVDVFEAVTSSRPYRGPMEVQQARSLIAEGAGSHFDPAVVEVFLDLEHKGLITREAEPLQLYDDSAAAVFDSSPMLRAVN